MLVRQLWTTPTKTDGSSFRRGSYFARKGAFEEEFSVGNAQEQQCDFFNFAMSTKCLIKEGVGELNFELEKYLIPTCSVYSQETFFGRKKHLVTQ
jgi:hypothetical protein